MSGNKSFRVACIVAAFVVSSAKVMPHTQPIVDAGLFVISGVMTCGDGRGYCLLGLDCTLDEEFLPDPQGHCKGLQNAFTPSAYFSCCKYKNLTGEDNFVYTMVDPAVSTLVNSYSESTTEKMNVDNDSLNNKFKDSIKNDIEQGVKDANILEEFHKHMEKIHLKNEDKDQKVAVSTSTMATTPHENESVSHETNEEESEEEEDDEEDEDDESNEKSDNNDIKTIQLGGNSSDRDEKETNESDENYDSNENDEDEEKEKEVNKEKEVSKDKDHTKKVDMGHRLEKNESSPGVNADTVVSNVKLFLNSNTNKVTQKPSKHTSKPSVHNNLIQSDTGNKEQNKVPNLDDLKEQYPYQQQSTSEKLCMRASNAPKCRTIWKFMHRTKTLCSGTMLDQMWMLTSASCLERLVHVGLKNVTVESHKDWKISNVVAYENYKSEYNHTHHDIGLVRLMIPIQRSICVPCIPRLNQKFVGSECSAPFSSSSQRSSGTSLLCQGLSEPYHSHGDEFMSLACRNPSGTNQNITDWNSGNGIICRGYLAGLQTPVRTEQLVYLQINPYVKWIQQNMKSTSISQKFQTGDQES